MTSVSRTALSLALMLGAPAAVGAQTPRLEISPAAVLVDERFRITLDGFAPGQEVTIRGDANGGVLRSSMTVRADDRGHLDVPDPMRLIWSATREQTPAAPADGQPVIVQSWTFTAESGGRVVATQTIERRAFAANVRFERVRERGLAGAAFFPPEAGRRPAVIVLPGSQGGIPGPAGFAGGLASRGYVTLALGYFNAEGLPPLLQNIPLEYFATAVEWLKAQPSVDPERIGVLGTSRGGELALLLGATYPSLFRVVVANVPSDVVWPSLSNDDEIPAWTLDGKPVPGVPGNFTAADLALSGRERFLKRMQDPAVLARAAIPVERIGGPLLLFSGKDDQLWPSDVFAGRVVERLKAHNFTHPVEHYSYENAGHLLTRPYAQTADVRQVRVHPVSKRPNMAGGTPEGQSRANEDAWGKLLTFLNKYLAGGSASPSIAGAQSASRPIGLGEARTLRSAILNEDRELQISLPETYSRTTIAYPVLFLLDGSSHLLHASATVRFLASARTRIPEMIVVAIPNRNRNRDMTPGPGASTFQRVLAEEIIPWVERNYRAAPERILVGHSLSASFAVHTLLNRPDLFRTYVAASAPLWRYQDFDADVRAGLPRAAKAGTAVYLTVGEYENDQLRNGVRRFADVLSSTPSGNAPAWSFTDMKGEDHSSTPQRSLYNALEARYADWRYPYFEDAAELARAGGLPALQAQAERISKHAGYPAYPPEAPLIQVGNIYVADGRHDEAVQLARTYGAAYPAFAERLVNQVGYDQLKRGQTDRALRTFKANADTYPGSPNVHDSLGDGYCRAGDAASARQSYERAARAAAAQSPPHPRLESYRDKATQGCAPAAMK